MIDYQYSNSNGCANYYSYVGCIVKSGPPIGNQTSLLMGAYALTPYLRGPTYRGLTNTHLLLFSRPTDYDISICCSFNHSSCIRTRRLTTRVASWSFNTTVLLPFYVTPIQYMITTSNNRIPSSNGSYLFYN